MPGVSDSLAVMLVGWGRRERIEIERKSEREKDRVSERYIVYRAGYENAKIWIENAKKARIENAKKFTMKMPKKIYYENAKKIYYENAKKNLL
jgi:hypothetical protein